MADMAPWETPQPQQPQAAAPAREGGLLQAVENLPTTIKALPRALWEAQPLVGAYETLTQGRSKFYGSVYDTIVKPVLEHKPIFEGMTPEEETETGFFGATLLLGGPRPFLRGAKPLVAPVQDAIKQTVTEPSAQRLATFATTGNPDGVPIEAPLPETKPSPIQPIQGSPNPNMRRLAAAQTGIPEVDAILNHPTIQSVIDNPVVDRSRTIPYEAGGSEPTNRPTTYLDKHVPQTFTVGGPRPDDIIAYHGTSAETDFGTHFDTSEGTNPSEHGVSFFSPTPGLANVFSSTNARAKARISEALSEFVKVQKDLRDKYGYRYETQAPPEELQRYAAAREAMYRAGDVPEGAPGARIIPVRITPGKTKTFDVSKMFGEDEQFHAMLREVNTNPEIGAAPPIYKEYTPEERESRFNEQIENYREQYRGHEQRRADLLKETADEEGGPHDIGPWKVPLGTNAIAAVIQMAKREGLDTARITNLAEGGEQIIALNADNIRPYFEKPITFDTAEPTIIHENVEEMAMYLLKKYGMPWDAAYRVSHFKIAQVAEHAWYRAHGIDPAAAEAEWKKIQPGIQHEIANDAPADLFTKEYPGADVTKARHEEVFEAEPTPEETARAFEILRNAPELQTISAPKLLNVANDLGVIGAPRRIDEGTPQEAAQRAVATAGPPGEKIAMEPNAARDKAGNIRLDQIGINADAKDTLLEAAKANDDFSQARQGNIPLTQIMSLSDATGIPLATLRENEAGLGRLMHNDAVVRTWLQAFHQATDDIAAQMKKAKLSGADADLETLRDMKLRLAHMQEQVSGLTAEAGRTLGVFREFYANKGKIEAIKDLMEKNPGNDLDSLKKLADLGSSLNPRTQLPRWLNNIREPGFWDKYLYYWVNALLSGPITHALYAGANFGMAAYDAGPVTLAAGIYGTLRRAVTGNTEGMYLGETPSRLFGLLTGTPQALKAAAIAARDNIQVPLPGEVAKNYNPIINLRPNPIGGKLGVVVGTPMRGATGIHSFFNFLGYRSSIEAQAYRMATQEHVALRPEEDFLNRWRFHANNPNPDMMAKGIEDGYRLTYIEEQGAVGKAVSRLANTRVKFPFTDGEWQPFKLIMPFTHIPGNIMKEGIIQSPLGPILDHETRSDLLGRNGMAAHDQAMGRLVMGGAVTAMVVNWALNDNITGYGPTDPTERALWLRTHQPYSIKLGGYWVSYNKFGAISDFIGVVANLMEIAPKVKEGQYSDAAGQVLKASSHLVMDEVGMQGVANIIEAMDNENKAGTYVAKLAASNIPFSSLLRQTASVTDPYTREAKTFVDNMRYTIPYARQDLLPRRDWLGQPVPNPGYATIVRRAPVNTDPLDYEMQRLQIKPGNPENRIGGVKLSPEMYDLYQEKAGLMTKMMLNAYVNSPGWNQLPDYNRETIIRKTIESARKDAGQALQMANPLLILQGIKQQQDYLSGLSHTKRPKEAPVLDETLQPPTLGIRG